jgi:4-alpha-glucanotransferase
MPDDRADAPAGDGAQEGWFGGIARSSGVLLHVTSLPDGRLGAHAHRFVDWLARAGQRWWQVLPLGPPDASGSPYAALSAFAGSPALLARPRARVSAREVADFGERNAYWAPGWDEFARSGAIEDQVRFEREWASLRAHAAERGVRLFGDIPVYATPHGADVACRPHLFLRDLVAGVPPDAFSADGQLWGNPLYDWPALRRERYRWWIERLRRVLGLVDVARIDHFRALIACWAVPAGARTARIGRWRRGPGAAPLLAARAELGRLALVAEDLGRITPPVERLRLALGLPGMRVLQFAFSGDPGSVHLPAEHPEDVVSYPGTHDNDTAAGWWTSAPPAVRARAQQALTAAGIREPEPGWALARLALASRARLAVVPAQDLLNLGSEARMNVPGTTRGNWTWRLGAGQLTAGLADRLREATARSGRL